jgi:ribosomal peptide maturation radical SAM protein 1
MGRTLLVCMPCAALERPPLALSLLKAELENAGQPCDLVYPNIDFAERLGLDDYRRLASGFPWGSLAGEWVFRDAVFEPWDDGGEAYLQRILRTQELEDRELLKRARGLVEGFLEDLVSRICWRDYDVIGFTASGDQNMASLALARRIRRAQPDSVIVVGGPNWHGPVGAALHRHFPFIDAVFLDEGDETFPRFVSAVVDGVGFSRLAAPGISVRGGAGMRSSGSASKVRDMDSLPIPDYGEYFSALEERGYSQDSVRPTLALEGSRGCAWGQRSPCTFCGLTHADARYRHKGPERLIDELRVTAKAHPGVRLDLADTMVSRSFLTEVLPQLASEPLGAQLYVEARPDLTREQVSFLARSQAMVQIGIESLSDHALQVMRKGSTALRNLRLLKWCHEEGLPVFWNYLCEVPGELPRDYEEVVSLVPLVRFLPPPSTYAPVRLERFSVLLASAESRGYSRVRAAPALSHIYPFTQAELDEIAFVFQGSRSPGSSSVALAMWGRRLGREIAEWQESPRAHVRVARRDDRHVVEDSRECRPADGLVLTPLDEMLCRACADICSWETLVRDAMVKRLCSPPAEDPGHQQLEKSVSEALDALVARGLMVRRQKDFLTLADCRDLG